MLELPKHMGLLLGRNATARVLDFKAPTRQRGHDPQNDVAFVCELDGIAQQIAQDLQQTLTVHTHLGGHGRMQQQLATQPFFGGQLARRSNGLFQQLGQIHVCRHQLQLARLQLREIQNVVDHLQ